MSVEEVQALDQFEEHPGFGLRERLALRYADQLLYHAAGDLDSLYAELRQYYSESELIELGSLIALNIGFVGHLIHSWNL